MRTANEVKEQIGQRMLWMLDRPQMYASNPESLEDQLSLLDDLRLSILMPDDARSPRGYTAYLMSEGYGVANFCHRYRENSKLSQEDTDLFDRLVVNWKRYFQSAYSVETPRIQSTELHLNSP